MLASTENEQQDPIEDKTSIGGLISCISWWSKSIHISWIDA